jgi:polysaccharide export outer membrane protein
MDTQSRCPEQHEHGTAALADRIVEPAIGNIQGGNRRVMTSGASLRGVLTVGAVAALTACTTTGNMPLAPPVPAPNVGYVTSLPPYRIQVGDILDVRLMLNPELNEEVAVRPDGRISTTVVADELAYGRTVPELTEALRRDYSRDLRNPRLTVEVKSFAPIRIYVGGEVNNPGEFINVGPTLTLSQAIARAGSHKLTADLHDVFIIRRGPNDVPEFLATHYNAVIHGDDPTADVRLAPYDVVYVPKTGIAEVYTFFNQYIQQFVPISWGFSYLVNNNTGVVTTPGAATH